VAPADRHLAHFQNRLKNRDWRALASDLTLRDEGGGFSALLTARCVSEEAVADREGKNADYTERTGKQASGNCAGAGVPEGAEARDLKRAAASLMVVTGAAAPAAEPQLFPHEKLMFGHGATRGAKAVVADQIWGAALGAINGLLRMGW
jgi:hypothetical protein